MSVTCAVCSDHLSTETEICSIPCGHTFHRPCLLKWFNVKRSCPECRKPAREEQTHRVYLHFENVGENPLPEDFFALNSQINNLRYNLSLKERDVQSIEKKLAETKTTNDTLRARVVDLEKDRSRKEAMIYCLRDQVSLLKANAKEKEKLGADIVELRKKLKQLESVDAALKSTPQEVAGMLDNEDATSLRLLVVTLKRALAKAEKDKIDSQHTLRKNEIQLQKLKSQLEKSETVVRELTLKSTSLAGQLKTPNVIDLTDEATKGQPPSLLEKNSTFGIPDLMTRSKQSNLNSELVQAANSAIQKPIIAESSNRNDGCHSINSRSTQTLPGYKNPSSLFKRHKTILENATTFNRSEFLPDGLGGHAKEDVFPVPKIMKTGIKREATDAGARTKFRKL